MEANHGDVLRPRVNIPRSRFVIRSVRPDAILHHSRARGFLRPYETDGEQTAMIRIAESDVPLGQAFGYRIVRQHTDDRAGWRCKRFFEIAVNAARVGGLYIDEPGLQKKLFVLVEATQKHFT